MADGTDPVTGKGLSSMSHAQSGSARRPTKVYLGDSVYVELHDYGDIELTTENGFDDDPRNRIVLDPVVLGAFFDWLRFHSRLGKEAIR